ncbi:hypothetical protein IST461_02828 [Burkholderia multivorans]|nr:hypothetical protein IST461_02828 [Burkholderia multivorans]
MPSRWRRACCCGGAACAGAGAGASCASTVTTFTDGVAAGRGGAGAGAGGAAATAGAGAIAAGAEEAERVGCAALAAFATGGAIAPCAVWPSSAGGVAIAGAGAAPGADESARPASAIARWSARSNITYPVAAAATSSPPAIIRVLRVLVMLAHRRNDVNKPSYSTAVAPSRTNTFGCISGRSSDGSGAARFQSQKIATAMPPNSAHLTM